MAACSQEDGGTVTIVGGTDGVAGQPENFPENKFQKHWHKNMKKERHHEVPCKPFSMILADHVR